MKNYKLALVGATGLVGRKAREVLEEEKLPISEYVFFSSARSAGTKIIFMGKEYEVRELKDDSFDEGFDFAIFSAGGETSKHFAPIAASKGCIVVDNSSAWRMDENVPLVVPEVNIEDAFENNGIIANPNCSTIQAVVPLKVLDDKYKIKRIVYSTYQAVSGAGKGGVDDFYNTQKGEEPKKWPHPIYNNCLPHIDSFLDNGYTKEEMKMVNETRKMLHKPDLPISATCIRVPVFNSHGVSVVCELEKDFEIEDVRELFKNYPGLVLADDPQNHIYPVSTMANDNDLVYVGRIRRDLSTKNGLIFYCVGDNIRKGAASNAVQIALYAIKHDML